MLVGQHTHSIDAKNRVSLPSKYRSLLGDKVYLTPGLDGCLFMFSASEWTKISKSLSETSFLNHDQRSFNRYFLGQAEEIEVDSQGRILLPVSLKTKVSLTDKVSFVGMSDRVEIWNDTKWQDYKKLVEKEADDLAQKLSNIGIL